MNENEFFDLTPSQEPADAPVAPQEEKRPYIPAELPDYPEVEEKPLVEEPPAPVYEVPPIYTVPPIYSAPQPRPEPPRAPERPKKKTRKTGLIIAVVAIALCCGLLGSICGGLIVGFAMENILDMDERPEVHVAEPTKPAPNVSELPPATATPEGFLTPAQVYAYNVASVVGIANESTTYNVFGQASETASSGSGFIISADGQILTNYHVIDGAQTLTVTLYDGSEYPATVLGYEASSDIALIKIDAQNLTPATLGNSSELYVGAEVAAIGNPLGELTYSLNVGYISSMERSVNTDGTPINMMQIDVSINPGNSGGPLFDMHGNVIGINTAKYSGTMGGSATIEGIGFAIPIDDVKVILDDLREDGAVLDRAYIGISPSSVTAAEAQRFNLPLGVYVESVEPGYCGEKAGLQKGDIIIAIDEHRIKNYDKLASTLKKYRAGDEAVITVYRSGQNLQLEIVFDARPADVPTEEPATEPSTVFDPWDFFFG